MSAADLIREGFSRPDRRWTSSIAQPAPAPREISQEISINWTPSMNFTHQDVESMRVQHRQVCRGLLLRRWALEGG